MVSDKAGGTSDGNSALISQADLLLKNKNKQSSLRYVSEVMARQQAGASEAQKLPLPC